MWQEGPVQLTVQAGHFVHEMGSIVPLTADVAAQGQWGTWAVSAIAAASRSTTRPHGGTLPTAS